MKNWLIHFEAKVFLQKTLASKAIPLFFELLEEFSDFNETKQSRNRIMLIADDTKSEKYGSRIKFFEKKLYPRSLHGIYP